MTSKDGKAGGMEQTKINDIPCNRELQDDTEADLRRGIAAGEFVLYLQPKVRLADGVIESAEALMHRCIDGQHISPVHFIPSCESAGVIRHLDLYGLEIMCSTIAHWRARGIYVPIAVNMSRVTLAEFGIAQKLHDVCSRYDIDPGDMFVEVTESNEMLKPSALAALVNRLHEVGFHVSLDDFGSGYSNLSLLADVTFDEIKIDQSLVRNIHTSPKNRCILERVVDMCHAIGVQRVVAEGVETVEQHEALLRSGCELGQGFWFARPMDIDGFYDRVARVGRTTNPRVVRGA